MDALWILGGMLVGFFGAIVFFLNCLIGVPIALVMMFKGSYTPMVVAVLIFGVGVNLLHF